MYFDNVDVIEIYDYMSIEEVICENPRALIKIPKSRIKEFNKELYSIDFAMYMEQNELKYRRLDIGNDIYLEIYPITIYDEIM